MIKETRMPSFGEDLMQVDVRVEPVDDVEKVKHLFAEIAEIMKKGYTHGRTPVKSLIFDHAVGEIVNAAAAVEKVLTYKSYRDEEQTV